MPGFEVIGQEEFDQIKDIFDHGGVLFRHGFDALRNGCFKVREFEIEFAKRFGVPHALAVTSGTAAIRVALAALGIKPGDEVITQSFTFVATVEGIIEAGATPVCAEIDGTLNLDPDDLKKRITSRTRAVLVVHMLGTPARLPEIAEVCRANNLVLIEDTAWGCGGNLHGIPLGTWGDIGTFSFDFAKTMTTGEGGMIVFKNYGTYAKAAAWHDHGHENNPVVPRWEDTRSGSGFNFRMNELQGAVGLAQLDKLAGVVTTQRANREHIWNAIQDIPGIEPRIVPEGAYETADALVFLVRNHQLAAKCRECLIQVGLSTKILPEAYTWHFSGTWTHMPELVAAHGGNLYEAFPQSISFLDRAVSLPITVRMADDIPKKARSALQSALQG